MFYEGIPSPSDIDSRDPEYVSKLEKGLIKIEELLHPVESELESISSEACRDVEECLKTNIPGVSVNKNKKLEVVGVMEEDGRVKACLKIHMDFFLPDPHMLPYAKELMQTTILGYTERLQPILERSMELREVEARFKEELLDKTRVIKLGSQNHFDCRLYIVRGDIVYESDVNFLIRERSKPVESHLLPEDLTGSTFKSKSRNNSYTVLNPSSVLTIDEIIVRAMELIVKINGINLTTGTLA